MDENKATSMDEFEQQLKQGIGGGATSLSDFENQLKQNVNPNIQGINPTVSPAGLPGGQVNQQKQTVKIRKNIVLSFPLNAVA